MTALTFLQQPGETILYKTRPNRKWYAIAWKIIIGLAEILVTTFLFSALLQGVIERFLATILPSPTADLISRLICLGLVPLVVALWVVEDTASIFIAEYILTDRRLWIKGSPYTWSHIETPLDDISSMIFRRDAIFVRQKSSGKIQIHMLSDGKLFVKAFEKYKEEK
jgi:hypothetical protein